MRSVTDWTELSGVQLELEAGTYTINASSNGFDGSESGFDIPYYAGSAQVTIPKGKEVTANIICTLANVKVTVNFDATFVQPSNLRRPPLLLKFRVNSLNFVMGTTGKSAYFR